MKHIKLYILTLFTAAIIISGCKKDFLDRAPLSQITTDNFYKSSSDLRLVTAALYAQPWSDWNNFPLLGIGDILSGNMLQPYNADLAQLTSFAVTSNNGQIGTSWRCFYKIVAHCNTNIKAINTKAADSIPLKNKNGALGELKFLRATAYFHLAQLWGAVPIIEDNDKLIKEPLLPRHRLADVYRFIVNDLRFAATALPTRDQAGRVTTWSAQGMLAKVYLTKAGLGGSRSQSDLDSAAFYAKNVINTSGLTLLPSYYNLFRTQFNDNSESLFAFQWAPGVGYGNGNGIQTQFAPSSSVVPPGGGWGGAIGPTFDLDSLYTPQDSIRRKATFMLTGDHYPELNAAGGGYTATSCSVKKHIVGTAVDNNAPTMDIWSSTEHNAILRLADVYLVYVEALLGSNGSTSDAEALRVFNMIRKRAGVDPVTTITAEALRNERRIELAFEGQYWFDLVRLSYYNPQGAITLLSNQISKNTRVQFTYDPATGKKTRNTSGIVITPPTIATFTLPIPATEITADPKLLDPPVAYY